MYEPLQIYLIVPRTFQLLAFIICAYLLHKKHLQPKDPGYSLNKTYIMAFNFWVAYIILDLIIPLTVPISLTESYLESLFSESSEEFIFISGYLPDLPSIFVGNILRDLQMTCALLFMALSYQASFIVKYGVKVGMEKIRSKKFLIILLIVYIPIVIFDREGVTINRDLSIHVGQRWDNFSTIGLILYLSLVTYSASITFLLYYRNHRHLPKIEKIKLFEFLIGYAFIIIGMYYWIFLPLILTDIDPLTFNYIGHLIWTISPMIFYLALKGNKLSNIKNKRDTTIINRE